MLSRVAESIYWMGRYIERAENVARFMEVNLQLILDDPRGEYQQWQPLVNTTGDHEDFKARYGTATQENVIQFLTFDGQNPNSILSCIRAARENARTVREIISTEMWLQLNKFYLAVTDAAAGDGQRALASPDEFFAEVRNASDLLNGIAAATLTHREPWHFFRMGQMLERADKTSRILDVKYFILLRSAQDVGTPFDDIQWAAVLRSASGFEMYRQTHGRISPRGVVEFLLFDRYFPRAIHYSLVTARNALHRISGTPLGIFRHPPEQWLAQLCSELAFGRTDEIIQSGLHEYLDRLQTQMNQVSTGISETFFAAKAPRPPQSALVPQ